MALSPGTCNICGKDFKNLGAHAQFCWKKQNKKVSDEKNFQESFHGDFVTEKEERKGWYPQDKQAKAIERYEFEILYGGARGGGKTDAGMAWMLHKVSHPRFRGLVIRLNAKDLNDWTDRARWMYRLTGADFKGQPTEIHFPSGAVIRTGHLKDENAYAQYQGHEYQRILIEELTQIPSERFYEQLISSCRSTVLELTPKIFATTNPGGPGHLWVKDRWNIPDQPDFEQIYKHPSADRIFIPAKIEDNPSLINVDPRYVEYLDSLQDKNLKRAWREGNWGNPVVEGAIYADEIRFLHEHGHIATVPWDPKYPVYTYWDLGKGPHNIVLFFQKPSKQWHLIDLLESPIGGLAKNIEILRAKGYFYGGHFAPHDIESFEWAEGDSRKNIATRMGIDFITLPKMKVEDGINATKMKLPLLYIDKDRCRRVYEALTHYKYEYNEETRTYTSKPFQDWTAHICDALRMWGIAQEPSNPLEETDFNLYAHTYN